MTKPNVEAVRWMAIGMAIANRAFAKKLSDSVGYRAFEGPSQDAFYAIEGMLAGIEPSRFIRDAVLASGGDGERLSDTILGVLSDESLCNFATVTGAHDSRKLAELSERIAKDAAELLSWARRIRT